MLASKAVPLMISESWKLLAFWPCDDGDEEFRSGVAMSMGEVEVIGMVKLLS
jgi:hypothetical protein